MVYVMLSKVDSVIQKLIIRYVKEKIKFDFPYANKLKKTFLSKIPVIDDIETARSFADKFLGLVKPERNQIISIQKVQKAPRNANSQKGSEKRPKNGPYSNRNSETRQRSIPR